MKEKLSEKEWNFHSVPPDEIEACFFYEYGREYFKQSRTLQKLRDQWEEYDAWASSPRAGHPPENYALGLHASYIANRTLRARHDFDTLIDFRTFPEMTWADLRAQPIDEQRSFRAGVWEARRRVWSREASRVPLWISTLSQLTPEEILQLPTWGTCGADAQTEHGLFVVNWDYPVPEIKRHFAAWLERRNAEPPVKPKFTRTSRGHFKDKLRWLGALRVKRFYCKSDLVAYGNSQLKINNPPYYHYPDLCKAAKRATNLILEMFPSEEEAAKFSPNPLPVGPRPLGANESAKGRRTKQPVRRGKSANYSNSLSR